MPASPVVPGRFTMVPIWEQEKFSFWEHCSSGRSFQPPVNTRPASLGCGKMTEAEMAAKLRQHRAYQLMSYLRQYFFCIIQVETSSASSRSSTARASTRTRS
jgi:hypothetical protein